MIIILTVGSRGSRGEAETVVRERADSGMAETSGQLQKSVDALGGGLTKIYCQVVYEERNKVCTFAT